MSILGSFHTETHNNVRDDENENPMMKILSYDDVKEGENLNSGIDPKLAVINASSNESDSKVREKRNNHRIVQRPKLLIIEPPVDVKTYEGQPFSLACKTNDPESTKIEWLFNGMSP